MKKLLFILICVLITTHSHSADQSSEEPAVTMVSYEQNWLDYQGTLALKNNTDKSINKITFRIIYLDMSGDQLDYKEFSRNVNIAPQMTKKIDIPAYEHSRHYSYYQSEAAPATPHKFNIKFQLLGFNKAKKQSASDKSKAEKHSTQKATEEIASTKENYQTSNINEPIQQSEANDLSESEDNTLPDIVYSIAGISIAILALVGFIYLFVLIAQMAKRRDLNPTAWVCIGIFINPILALIILACIRKTNHNNQFRY